MAIVRPLINGGVPVPVVAPPPPAVPVAPPPPQLPPASAAPPIADALLQAAGVTREQVDAANAAAAVAAASMAALLEGQGSVGIAQAAQSAGAPESVTDAILALGVPDITSLLLDATAGADDAVTGTDDLADVERLAAGNLPDLAGLPPFDLVDPFGERTLAAANPPLKGGGALASMVQAAADYGIDALAVVANALHEGATGAVGDGGLAYGPFQDHLTEFSGRPFYGKGRNNPVVNSWAWSDNGLRYSVRQMAAGTPSARGLRGHQAVYAIVYGYERPADRPGAYRTRAAEYDHLVKLGGGWPKYAADLLKGPVAGGGVDTTPIKGEPAEPVRPAGVVTQWRGLIGVLKTDLPKQHARVNSLSKSLVEVFR